MGANEMSKDFYLLILSRVCTRLGDGFLRIVSILLVAAKTKDPMIAGLVLVFRYVCEILINAISGPIIDRMRIRDSMMISDFLRTVLSILLIAAVFMNLPYPLFLILSFLGDFVFIFFKPAADKVVKVTFSKKEGTKALSLADAANHVSNIGGYALASFLAGVLGLETTVLLGPVFFGLSLLFVSRFQLPGEGAIDYKKVRTKSYWASQKEGLRYTWANLPLRMLLIGRSLVAVGRGSFTVLSVVYLADIAKGLSAYGYFESAQSAGKVLVTLFVIPLFFAYRSTFFLTAVSLIIIGLSFFSFVLVSDVVLACVVGAMVGAGQASEAVGIDAIINRYSEAHIQGRAKSTTSFGSRLSGLAAIGIVYFLVTVLNYKAQTLFGWLGVFPLMASVVFFVGWRQEKVKKEFRFRLVAPGGDERLFTLAKPLVRIGKGGQCDVVLQDPHVSDLHCLLEMTAEGPLLEDLNSARGTFVNGTRISRVTLMTGDQIALGKSQLHFEQDVEDAEKPARPLTAPEEVSGVAPPVPPGQITPLAQSEGAAAREPAYRFLVGLPDDNEIFYPIAKTEVCIGRSEQSDLVLHDRNVSRRHCVLRWEGDELFLEDLDSTSGTYVNGREIASTLLALDDRIQLGETELILCPMPDNIPLVGGMPELAGPKPPPSVQLLITPPEGPGWSHRLKTSETRIGRSALCDVVLQDSLVSRVHCLLRRSAEGGLTLEDLNSANGTSVNGERIDHARLKPGDLIVMGKTEIVVAPLTQSHQEDESEMLTVARPPTRPSVRAG